MAKLHEGHLWSRLAIPAVLMAAVAAAMVLLGSFGSLTAPRAQAAPGSPTMYLDASAPFCTTGQADAANNAIVLDGSPVQVGICMQGALANPQVFEATIGFNPAVLTGTEIIQSAPNLSDNPDANDGTGSTHLGTAWDCTNFNTTTPVINTPAGTTHISCADTTLGGDSQLSTSPNGGLLATATYSAIAAGSTTLTFSTDGTSSAGAETGLGNCDATVPNSNSNCVNATVTVLPAADIGITKSAPLTAIAGSAINYQLVVTNSGPDAAGSVTVFDDLVDNWVAGTPLVDGSPGPCVVIPLISGFVNVVSCGLGPMPPTPGLNSSHTIDIPVTTSSDVAGKLVVNSALAGDGAQPGNIDGVPDPNFTPMEAAACALDLAAGDAPVAVGNAVCPGGSALNNTANDVSPLNLCASDRYDGTPFDPGPAGPGGPAADFVDVIPGIECNNVALAATQFASANLTVTKTLPAAAGVGDTINVTVNVSNGAGASPASTVTATDTVDANQSIVTAGSGTWTCTITGTPGVTAGNTANCTHTGDIASPGSDNIPLTVKVLSSPANVTCQDWATVTFADPITRFTGTAAGQDAADPSFTCLPPNVAMYKDKHPESPTRQNVVNLWICDPAYDGNFPAPAGPGNYTPAPPAGTAPCNDNGEGRLIIGEMLTNVNDPEGLGAYEFQIKFDHKIFDITVQDSGWLYSTGRVPDLGSGVGGCTNSIINENAIVFGCVSKDDPSIPGIQNGPTGNGMVAQINIVPDSDVKFRLSPGQENGIVRKILDENCEAADIFGDPLADANGNPLPGIVTGGLIADCDSLDVTVRILEGDLNTDCIVDVLDDQAIAFRYGAFFGNLRYDPWYDLEPALKDFDIDIKDLQKVFGRNGSVCSQSGTVADGTIPAQPPQTALSNGPL